MLEEVKVLIDVDSKVFYRVRPIDRSSLNYRFWCVADRFVGEYNPISFRVIIHH